jgi:alkanesulfonate monooxygenase SsuD/methylene tetrahydromethanopterin reductase-like flavin-dependent oxidoreductase (luciferase family)
VENRGVYPRPYQEKLPIWLAVGGTPESVVRAATLGLPLALAIIGGNPARFTTFTDLYKETYMGKGHNMEEMQIAVHSHGFIAETSKKAADIFYGPYAHVMTQLGRERGWGAMTRDYFDMLREPKGSLLVGDPQEVTDKILYEQELFGLTRFLLHISVGTMPHADVMKCIELLGNVVAPAVRKALGK